MLGGHSSLSFFMNDIFNFKVKADEIIHDLKNDVEDFGNKKKTKDIKPMIQ